MCVSGSLSVESLTVVQGVHPEQLTVGKLVGQLSAARQVVNAAAQSAAVQVAAVYRADDSGAECSAVNLPPTVEYYCVRVRWRHLMSRRSSELAVWRIGNLIHAT
jgi:hypothetical protein